MLLDPLLELCQQHHLIGVTNAARLHDVLRRYQPDQVEHAIALLIAQIRAGAPIRSPIGLLVRLAEQRHPAYFPAHLPCSVESGQAHPAGPDTEGPPSPNDVNGEHEHLPAELLDEIDRHVEASLRALPTSIRNRLTDNEDSRQRLRLESYRTLAAR